MDLKVHILIGKNLQKGLCKMVEKIFNKVQEETSKKISENIPRFEDIKVQSQNIPGFQGLVRSDVDKRVEDKKIEEKSPYSVKINDSIATEDELDIYIDAGLKESTVNDKPALVRDDIDFNQVDENTGETNLERMKKGKPPLDKDGNPIELHHVGQKADSPLAELNKEQHRGEGNYGALHDNTQKSEIDRKEFAKEKAAYWKARAEQYEKGE